MNKGFTKLMYKGKTVVKDHTPTVGFMVVAIHGIGITLFSRELLLLVRPLSARKHGFKLLSIEFIKWSKERRFSWRLF